MSGNRKGRFKRVVLLGFDGLDPALLRQFMKQGLLPAFSSLAQRGDFVELKTSNPPQSPVSWACITTGVNPGSHGVFDFLHRRPEDYVIQLSMTKQGRRSLLGRPTFRPPLNAPTLFDKLCAAGLPAAGFRWPLAFPAQGPSEMLSGLGTPDILGGLGSYILYTTAEIPKQDPKSRHTIKLSGSSPYLTQIPGPFVEKPKKTDPLSGRVRKRFKVEVGPDSATLFLGGDRIRLKEGQWSPYVSVSFKVSFLQRVSAIFKFYLARARNPFILYLSPAEIDPRNPVFPISFPSDLSNLLARNLGSPFHTIGMPEDTKALRDGVLSPEAFIESCLSITEEQERMLFRLLEEKKEGVFGFVFFTSDRMQHLFWAGLDQEHPFRQVSGKESPFDHSALFHKLGAEPIRSYYRRLDSILGKVLEGLTEKDLLLTFSDHGFTTYRRNFDTNRFLVEEGYMSIEEETGRELFQSVRWDRTYAYACGFCGIYVNREGREGLGVASSSKAQKLIAEIKEKLLKLKDPETGANPVRRVWERKELYNGEQAENSPDLILGLQKGYRVAWQTALGGCSKDIFSFNLDPWSGTHLVAPELVPGLLLTNGKIKRKNVSVLDIAPTVFEALGVKVPEEFEGKSFLEV